MGSWCPLFLFYSLHAKGYSVACIVYFNDLNLYLLLKMHYGHGVADELVGKLGDVDKSLHLDAEIYEATEVGDVGDDAIEHHAFLQVVYCVQSGVEGEFLVLATRVATRFA
jgi:hypothetical protein